ncbi:MAG: SagB/ThcOx family dehydrogenase [Prevotella sp.]|jgi:SagB-type dehydrogenase family enzyme|nr:SagB/ThcOx family dehydrogenase [Prevotella sp.]MDR2005408.1 SagB/ThcOx family dehydrogenase [Prevotella sp.]
MRINNKTKEHIKKMNAGLYGIQNIENSLGLIFHENSKQDKNTIQNQYRQLGLYSSPYVMERASQAYKAYPGTKTYSLQVPTGIPVNMQGKSLLEILSKRRSGRKFSKYLISINELSILLYYSYGEVIETEIQGQSYTWKYRPIPSAGALYPLELYFYLNNSILPSGLYHFRPDKSIIELIKEEDRMSDLKKIIVAEPYVDISNCSCVFFVTSVFERTMMKYAERGYRFIVQEVGELNQTISLICEYLNLRSCIIGSFEDYNVDNYLQIDGVFESIQSIVIIGK